MADAAEQPNGSTAAELVGSGVASKGGGLRRALSRQRHSWAGYFGQGVTPAALALALLYLTVLSFGTLMTAYLKWRGMVEAELSVYRG